MKQLFSILYLVAFLLPFSNAQAAKINVIFEETKGLSFIDSNKNTIEKIIRTSDRKVRMRLPSLSKEITVQVKLIDRNLDEVGGVTGRADTPNLVLIEISMTFPGGVRAAIDEGLASTVFHEFHHLVRGWTMQGNKFGPGIPIAAVNEGLATVFAEELSGKASDWASYPKNVDDWVKEILELPKNAPYSHWMMDKLEDGRKNVGYRAGRYIIHEAMSNSGKSIIELSDLVPYEILDLAKQIDHHVPSISELAKSYENQNRPTEAVETYQKAYKLAIKTNNENADNILNKINLVLNPIVITKEMLDSYVGIYQSERLNFDITSTNGKLFGEMAGRPKFELVPEAQNVFTMRMANTKFEFVENEESRVSKLLFHANGNIFDLTKSK